MIHTVVKWGVLSKNPDANSHVVLQLKAQMNTNVKSKTTSTLEITMNVNLSPVKCANKLRKEGSSKTMFHIFLANIYILHRDLV